MRSECLHFSCIISNFFVTCMSSKKVVASRRGDQKVMVTSFMDEPEPSGDSKVSERIIGHGNALEYCLCGFFFCLWLFDNVQEERNLLVFDLATMFPFPFSVPTAVITSDLGPEKYSFIILHSFHIHYRRNLGVIWIIP